MSLTLHGVILTLMLVNFNFAREYSKPPSVILHIDLNKVQISNKTNLPQTAVKVAKKIPNPVPKPKEKLQEKNVVVEPKPKVQPKKESNPVPQATPKSQPETQQTPTPKPVEPVKDAVLVKKTPQPQSHSVPKNEPKKVESDTPKDADLQSLLASVEKVRRQPIRQPETAQNNLASDTGNTGLEGRLDQMLTISEKDFISSKLRECWSINGGTQDLEEILVEVKAYINKDGTVRDVQILNHQNYPAFQSVAESAKRAVHICSAKGVDSPFYILSQKYAEHYGDWKEIYLRFSPLKGVS